MKNKIYPILFILLFIYCMGATGQVSNKIYGKPEDFKLMAKRTLLVELMEENPKAIESLKKNPKKAKQLKDYRAFITEYNSMIRMAVGKYWKFNEKIDYKTESEIKKIRESKSTEYVTLSYSELGDNTIEIEFRSSLLIPVFLYNRIENEQRSPDYKIYFPSSFVRKSDKYLECDYKMALVCMQANLDWNIKNNKSLNFLDYAENRAETNCPELAKKTLLVEKAFLYKDMKASEAKAEYGKPLELVNTDSLNNTYLGNYKNRAVLFSIPYGMLKGNLGPMHSSAIAYCKVVVDCETNEILFIQKVGMGKSYVFEMIKADFKRLGECKM